jgi:hypothetical protein
MCASAYGADRGRGGVGGRYCTWIVRAGVSGVLGSRL